MTRQTSQLWATPRIARVPFAYLAAIMHEVFSLGGRVRIQVEGDSMRPWLRHGEDHVVLASPHVRLWGRGDVVLAVDDRGRYVMHRVFRRRQGCVWLLGDAQTGPQGPWRDEQMIALVERVVRRGRELEMTSPVARLFAWGWLICRPFRPGLLGIVPWFRRQWRVVQGRR